MTWLTDYCSFICGQPVIVIEKRKEKLLTAKLTQRKEKRKKRILFFSFSVRSRFASWRLADFSDSRLNMSLGVNLLSREGSSQTGE